MPILVFTSKQTCRYRKAAILEGKGGVVLSKKLKAYQKPFTYHCDRPKVGGILPAHSHFHTKKGGGLSHCHTGKGGECSAHGCMVRVCVDSKDARCSHHCSEVWMKVRQASVMRRRRQSPIELTPLAAKMKPLTDEVIQAIEDGDITTNNHTLVSRIKTAVERPRPSRSSSSSSKRCLRRTPCTARATR